MARFLYFVQTDKPLLSAADIRSSGLGHVLDGPGDPSSRGTRGPDGLAGVIFAGDGKIAGYDAATQTWKPLRATAGGPRVFIGLEHGAKPGPEELARRIIGGEHVKLRDGNDWSVPIARSMPRAATLPKELTLGEDGETWLTTDLPEFVTLCRDAERVFDLYANAAMSDDGQTLVEIEFKEGMRIAIEAMQVNYRIGPMEASLLRLFSEDEMFAVLRVICDMNEMERLLEDRQKKESAPASLPIDGGSLGTFPDTSRASAT